MIATESVTATAPQHRLPAKGSQKPRISPPVPVKSDDAGFRAEAASLGITLIPWQKLGGRYLEARRPNGKRQFREVAFKIARQNGKTTEIKPFITRWLRMGYHVMHIAHDRNLPRDMFDDVATALSNEPELFEKRRGRTIWPRYGAGQEEIKLQNGGRYRIAAARTGGARGWPTDILIIDECREMESFDVIDAAMPGQTASADPLTIYLSNAGTDKSVVLKSLETRAANGDPDLAFLEWSASPDLDAGDRRGWAQANPSLGYLPGLADELERAYRRALASGNVSGFETEHLCRTVPTLMPQVVPDVVWQRAAGPLPEPSHPALGIKVDPEGRRASAVAAWVDGSRVYVMPVAEETRFPLNVDAFADILLPLARQMKVNAIGYDPWTDRDLARRLPNTKAINGADYFNAGERFVRSLQGGQLMHADDGTIGGDLAYTVRREGPHGWFATRADAERPTTAAEAAIRAVWLATVMPVAKPRVY